MRLVGTKMDFFGIQGIKLQRRITWYPQGQQIITEVKLPHVRPTTLATVQIMCTHGDSSVRVQIRKHFDCGLTQVWYISCIQFLGVIDLGQLKLMTRDYLWKSTLLTLEFIVPNFG